MPRSGSGSGSRIHQGLVGARALIGTPYLADPALRREYERDVAPRTIAALGKVLRELYPTPRSKGGPRRVLDLAAGTGAAGAAVQDHFGTGIALTSVDQVTAARGARVADVTDFSALTAAIAGDGRFDLVVAAHVFNELFVNEPADQRLTRLAALAQRWCELLLADGGTLILLEPALRETSRALLGVRDRLLGAGLHIVAPCFFTGPCPALLRDRDWCHDAAAPVTAGRVASGASFSSGPPQAADRRGSEPTGHRVDFSYLVVRSAGDPVTDPTLFRIVSDPLPEKGRLRFYGCGSSGRHAVVRLDRHLGDGNRDFDRLRRGDVARIQRTTFAQDGLRVGIDTTVSGPGSAMAGRFPR
ncbi:MAG: small ribosomal subunit Rsm22 family protein [Verrucomicrobiota bacterium]